MLSAKGLARWFNNTKMLSRAFLSKYKTGYDAKMGINVILSWDFGVVGFAGWFLILMSCGEDN